MVVSAALRADLTTGPARALTVAGSDSGGGAGIQADLKTFTALGAYGMSVITAVTAQNTRGVAGVYPMTAEQVDAQLEAVLTDIGVDAVKTGMLVDADIIHAVARRLARYAAGKGEGATRPLRLVVDPVMVAKSGDSLLEDAAVASLREHLLPLAAVVTPNVPEAEALTGMTVRTRDDMVAAGRRLLTYGAGAVLITGGHLAGGRADDVLVTEDDVRWFSAAKIQTPNTHGTGCTLSAALAAGLARGLPLVDAVQQAKDFITAAIATAPNIGGGHGPTNHLAWLERERGHERSRRPTPRTLEDKLALYVIVDARTPVQLVADLLDAGVGAVQLRDKSLPPGDQVQPARRLQRLCRAKDALFFVNDHVDVALAVSADGVHLGQNDRSLREARLLLGPDALIGATVRTVEQAEAAAAQGADYLGVGPIYESVTKPGRTPLGVDVIKRIRAAVRLPLVAISGIAAGRAAPVIEAGATGAAVIAGILRADDPVQAAAALGAEIRNARLRRAADGAL